LVSIVIGRFSCHEPHRIGARVASQLGPTANTSAKSQAIQAGPHIFVSGQIPADAEGKLTQGSIADKTKACCEGVKNILEEAGSSIAKVVKVRFPLPFYYRLRTVH